MKPSVMTALWLKEWLTLSRDRHGMAALFVMPAVFILIMSLALRDTLRPDHKGARIRYAFLDQDHSPESKELGKLLAGSEFQEDKTTLTDQAAQEAIASGRLPFAVVIPRGFAQQMAEAESRPGLVSLRLDPTVAILARVSFRQRLDSSLGLVKVHLVLRQNAQFMGNFAAESLDTERVQALVAEEAVSGTAQAQLPSAVQQNVPAWLIFGMFFVVIPLSGIFITERHHGTLQRLRSMGIGHGTLLFGKLLPFILVNLIQTVLMVGVGVWLVPLFGGEALSLPAHTLLPLATMALAVSLAAVSWALLVASAVTTTEQATIFGGVGNILMAALGGIMVPRFVMPPEMRFLTKLSPMAWGLDGFHAIMLRGQGWSGMLPWAACLIAFAVVAVSVAIGLSRRGSPNR